ncbi:MAG: site-specific integrase, partial [Bacteroidales bacterium]|nr:site-specific integrase [Bacteroidales bacterium]
MNDCISDFLVYLKVEKNYSELTVEAYRKALQDYEDFVSSYFGAFDPLNPELIHARAWMVEMGKRKWKVASIKLQVSALRSFYKFLRKKGMIEENPLDLLPTPQVPKPLPVWVREEQMDSLIDETEFGNDFEGVRDHLIVTMLYSTGMRRSEIAGVLGSDVDFSLRNIRVTGKGNKQRLIPFGQELYDLLKNYEAMRNETVGGPTLYLFTNADGEGLKP